MKRANAVRIDFATQKLCDQIIRSHATITQNDRNENIVQYQDQWNDARVARELSAETATTIHSGAVERFRRKYIGGLAYNGGSMTGAGIRNPILRISMQARARVDKLEPRVAVLEDILAKVCAKAGIPLPADFGMSSADPAEVLEDEPDNTDGSVEEIAHLMARGNR